jgi:hypothetical protein
MWPKPSFCPEGVVMWTRFLLCVFALVCCCSPSIARAERLVESVHVIYREASNDYLFSVDFSEPVSFIDGLAFNFRPHGPRPSDGLLTTFGMIGDSLDDASPGWIRRTLPQPTVHLGDLDPTISDSNVSFVLDRDVISDLGPLDTLFPYGFSAGDDEREFLAARIVALNVPEPSTLLLAMGTLLCVGLATARRSRLRRPPNR